MCGIYGLINYKQKKHGSIKNLESMFIKGSKRGPETSNFNKVICDGNEILLGFHRLAINGYNKPTSEQPIKKGRCILICNGEIYNWKHLNKLSNSNCNTGSDCEIIIDLYKKYGPQQTLNMLDGVYAFILIDFEKESVFIARDTYGVRPLFKWELKNGSFLFASEIKMGFKTDIDIRPEPFAPGSYIYSSLKDKYDFSNIIFSQPNSFINSSLDDVVNIRYMIRKTLMTAVEKRVDNTDREIACLLSGGLDSSLITALVVNIYNNLGKGKKIHTWSIGMDGSEDLKYARLVADYLKTEHHEIKLKEDDFIMLYLK